MIIESCWESVTSPISVHSRNQGKFRPGTTGVAARISVQQLNSILLRYLTLSSHPTLITREARLPDLNLGSLSLIFASCDFDIQHERSL